MTLVIMAAGIGSRFGGLKQIEPVGPNGEFIIDYSIDGISYQQLINPFKFYATSSVNYQVIQYEPNLNHWFNEKI